MSLSIQVMLSFIAVLLCLLSVLMLYIIMKRQQQEKVFEIKRHYIELQRNVWYRYLVLDEPMSPDLIPHNKGQYLAVEEVFLAYIDNVSNEQVQLKITDFAKRYLFKYYAEGLQKKKWSYRMNALFRIADFRIDTMLPQCKTLFEKDISKEENYILLTIFSLFATDLFQEALFRKEINTFSEFEYRRIFSTVPNETIAALAQKFDDMPTKEMRYAFVDFLGQSQNIQLLTVLEQHLNSYDSELRIRTLKSIYALNWVENIELYEPFLRSAIWEERLMLGKILQHFPLAYGEVMLRQLMQDQNWWVRKQAAETIASHKDGGKIFAQLIETTEDRYAKELAQEMLERGIVI